MYTDYFLRFADEAEANGVLFEGDGEERRAKYTAVDVIGTIYKPTGKVLPAPDGSGDAVDEMAPVEGWHVNIRHTADAPELEAFQVFPATPARMWA